MGESKKYPPITPKPEGVGGYSRMFSEHRAAMVARGITEAEAGLYWSLVARWEPAQFYAQQSVTMPANSDYVATKDQRAIDRMMSRLKDAGFVTCTRPASRGRRALWWPNSCAVYPGAEYDAALQRVGKNPYRESLPPVPATDKHTRETLTRPNSRFSPSEEKGTRGTPTFSDKHTHEMLTRPYSGLGADGLGAGTPFSDPDPDPDHDHDHKLDPDTSVLDDFEAYWKRVRTDHSS